MDNPNPFQVDEYGQTALDRLATAAMCELYKTKLNMGLTEEELTKKCYEMAEFKMKADGVIYG